MLRTVSRLTIEGYVRLARLPADALVRLAGGANGGTGGAVGVKLALDRAEAAFRAAAGTVLGDEVLREDGRRRAEAAAERERALDLRRAADRRSEQSDEHLAERRDQAERQRAEAERDAERKRERAQREREARKARAVETAQQRKQAAQESAQAEKRAAAERARRARLEALDAKSEALDEKETALTAADEARRLKAAAAQVKATRKHGA
jgi:colicin import membrane protein